MDAKTPKQHIRRILSTLPLLALSGNLIAGSASAQSLQEALAAAYQSNPSLEAQRAQLRATDELVPQARAGYLPNLEAAGDVSRTRTESAGQVNIVTGRSVDLNLSQPIYRGGRTSAGISRAENLVQSQRAALIATEQDVLLGAATAYLNVVRDQAVLELNINNEQVLRRQLEASQDRFRVGEITRTDVSQAESRLARATADRILAEGILNASRAEYARLVGAVPGKLTQPAPTIALPSTLEETIALATDNNPAVVGARFAEAAAQDGVDVARGQLLPSVSVVGNVGRTWDQPRRDIVTDSASIIARVTVPIYQAGAVTSQVREAKQTASQRRIQVEGQTRSAREAAIRAWEALVTARASIKSRQSQVRSAEIALEGVRQEATVGSRTVLDVLDAEQELLDARVQLVRAQRDELVATFQVLAATGQLTAGRLGLPVQTYDYEANYRNVRNKLWGTSID